jgi:hypothetical protein
VWRLKCQIIEVAGTSPATTAQSDSKRLGTAVAKRNPPLTGSGGLRFANPPYALRDALAARISNRASAETDMLTVLQRVVPILEGVP